MNVDVFDTFAHRVGQWARRPWVWVMCGVMAFAVLAALLRFGPMFSVSEINVTGVEQVSDADVIAAASIDGGTPLLTAPVDEIAAQVEQLDAVADAQVTRDWPNTLTISVRERRPVGYVTTPGGFGLVGSDGNLYSQQKQRPEDLPRLPSVAATEIGDSYRSQLNSGGSAALDVAVAVPTRLQRSLQRITAHEESQVVLAFDDGVLVRWGSSAAGEAKIDVVTALHQQPGWGQRITVVDVTAPEAPAFR